MAPFFVTKLLQCPTFTICDTSSLHTVLVGGSSMSKEKLLQLRSALPNTNVNYVYGMTENHGFCTQFHPVEDRDLINEKIDSVGRGLPGYSYKVNIKSYSHISLSLNVPK